MTREISFRAWDSYQNKMYDWNEIVRLDIKNHLSLSNLLNGFINHIKPMQSTGLKDKNQKMIFEGDVVTSESSSIGSVIFINGSFRIDFHDRRYLKESVSLLWQNKIDDNDDNFGVADIEVVGNKWENPELLKE